MTNKKLGLYIKYGKKEHLMSLQKGCLYFSPVSYFTSNPDRNLTNGQFDQFENINISLVSNEDSILQVRAINNETKESKIWNLQWARITTGQSNDYTHIWGCFALNLEYLDSGEHFLPDEMDGNFGNYMLIITDVTEFQNRVKNACIKHNISMKGDLIDYKEESVNQENMTIFNKFSSYKYQSEYRYAIKLLDSNPYNLDIGSIEDISRLTCHKNNRVEVCNGDLILKINN